MKEKLHIFEKAVTAIQTGNLKSDSVVVSQGRVHVFDITVRHEDAADLEEGHRSKVEKYTPLLDILV
jgi:hypothetical protein